MPTLKPIPQVADPVQAALRAELVRKITAHTDVEGVAPTAIPGLRLYRKNGPTECYSGTYEPELVICAQGEKHITVGSTTHICDETKFLLTSVDLPAESQVIRASKKEPILCMVLKLEMPFVREILSQQEFLVPGAPAKASGFALAETSPELLKIGRAHV